MLARKIIELTENGYRVRFYSSSSLFTSEMKVRVSKDNLSAEARIPHSDLRTNDIARDGILSNALDMLVKGFEEEKDA